MLQFKGSQRVRHNLATEQQNELEPGAHLRTSNRKIPLTEKELLSSFNRKSLPGQPGLMCTSDAAAEADILWSILKLMLDNLRGTRQPRAECVCGRLCQRKRSARGHTAAQQADRP